MKKLVAILLIAPTLWLSAVAQTTPTADEILNKYIKAIGGRKALSKVNDVSMDASLQLNGNTMQLLIKQKAPGKFLTTVNAGGNLFYKTTSDGSSVVMTNAQGTRPIEGSKAQVMLVQNHIFPEMHLAEHGIKTTVVGPEQINGRNTYKLLHTTADGSFTWNSNYDAENGLKVQEIRLNPSGVTETVQFDDYKEIEGIKYPFKLTAQIPQYQAVIKIGNVQLNKGLNDSEFTVQ